MYLTKPPQPSPLCFGDIRRALLARRKPITTGRMDGRESDFVERRTERSSQRGARARARAARNAIIIRGLNEGQRPEQIAADLKLSPVTILAVASVARENGQYVRWPTGR
jgi:hypothetical protein